MKRAILFFVLIISLFLVESATALDTSTLTWNASLYVVDNAGEPLDGDVACSFSLVDCNSGIDYWSENQTCSFSNGLVSAVIGDTDPVSYADFFDITSPCLNLVLNGEEIGNFTLSAAPLATLAQYATTAGSVASISSSAIPDGTIATANLADSAVTSAKISSGAIATGNLATGAVTSVKISDDAVTASKLDDSMAPTWTGAHTYTNTGTTTDVINITAASLTTGSAIQVTGPSGGSSGISSGGLLNLTSDVGSTVSSPTFGLISSTATLDSDTSGEHSSNLYLSTDHTNSSNGNTAYGIYSALTSDTTAGSNVNTGIYSDLDISGTQSNSQAYGFRSIITSDATAGGGAFSAYGYQTELNTDSTSSNQIVAVGFKSSVLNRSAADEGTRTTKGAEFTCEGNTNGSSTATAVAAAAYSADENYAGVFYSGHVVVGQASFDNYSNLPEYSLIVQNGAFCVDNGGTNCDDAARDAGTVYSVGADVTGIDLAENYPTHDENISAGEIVMIDSKLAKVCLEKNDDDRCVKKGEELVPFITLADDEMPERVVGVVSTDPGVTLGGFGDKKLSLYHKVPVALAGRVPVKVNDEQGPIRMGDLLTISSRSGVARRAVSGDTMMIGKALEDWDGNSEKLTMLVQPTQVMDDQDEDRLSDLSEEVRLLKEELSQIKQTLAFGN